MQILCVYYKKSLLVNVLKKRGDRIEQRDTNYFENIRHLCDLVLQWIDD